MSNKTKIILVSIVGVIVVFGIGALAGNLMHSNSNTTAKSTSVSTKSSTKATSSSTKEYVEGKDYTVERTQIDGVTNSTVDTALLKAGYATNQNNNLSNYMKKYSAVEVYYDSRPELLSPVLDFVFLDKDGQRDIFSNPPTSYKLDDEVVHSNDSFTTSKNINESDYQKLVWKFTNKDLTK
ncbi:putative two-component histidine kinase [Weissella oryzae SG25]|uniref:Putative two-component histidine kinase n=1 Tax=Weissella oryzae (strain DSM 25784 / JCM 18191 / LMG 30913 / SG25) TaxID=1329250 RepID=A0A069CWT3_WEIOS|nr:hypothetical protein [Weissella oryzae]GAK31929.1 putative two-component histidine kinase [Weissella oryzae SG25]